MRTQMVSRACSNCSGDYENPDLTAPPEGEGDVENLSDLWAERRVDCELQVTDNTGVGDDFSARETLSDAGGRPKGDFQ